MRVPFVSKLLICLALTILSFSYFFYSQERESTILYKGVIDRIVNKETAIILIQEKQLQIKVPIHKLPHGTHEGAWLMLHFSNGTFTVVAIDNVKTQDQYKKLKHIYQQIHPIGSYTNS